MTYPSGLDVARGLASGCRAIRQFGRNTAVGGTFAPIARSGVYRTPQAGAVVALRIRAGGNAADTANGAGARSIRLTGLDANGDFVTEVIVTAGASASAASQMLFLRLTDAMIETSGTYATQAALSHAGTINIEDTAGNLWATIQDTDIPRGETEIAAYSVPRYRAFYIQNIRVQSFASNKANIVMFKRPDILQTSAPYSPMTLLWELPEFSGAQQFTFDPPIRIDALSDVGFLAKTGSSTTDVSIGFDAIEVLP
jgi:hypothetical protein